MPLDLIRLLAEEPGTFGFFQAVRLLEEAAGREAGAEPAGGPGADPVRFESEPAPVFPVSDVIAFTPARSLRARAAEWDGEAGGDGHAGAEAGDGGREGPGRLAVAFLSLYGVTSPLPDAFLAPLARRRPGAFPLRAFLDMFGHRLHTLFYRAWASRRHAFRYAPGGGDALTGRLLALTGAGYGPLRPPDAPGYARWLGLAGLFGARRPARGLERLLEAYFGFPLARVREFAAARAPLPELTRLGGPHRLGREARLGHTYLDRQGNFTVTVGPITADGLIAALAPGAAPSRPTLAGLLAPVRRVVDAYLAEPLEYRIRVAWDPSPGPARLGAGTARLGLGAWIGEKAEENA